MRPINQPMQNMYQLSNFMLQLKQLIIHHIPQPKRPKRQLILYKYQQMMHKLTRSYQPQKRMDYQIKLFQFSFYLRLLLMHFLLQVELILKVLHLLIILIRLKFVRHHQFHLQLFLRLLVILILMVLYYFQALLMLSLHWQQFLLAILQFVNLFLILINLIFRSIINQFHLVLIGNTHLFRHHI